MIDKYKGLSLNVNELDFIITPNQYLEIPTKNIHKIIKLLVDKMYTCPKNKIYIRMKNFINCQDKPIF